MAKSNRRQMQDRARVESRHAGETRRQDRADAERHADGLFDRATDPALAPDALAALIMSELADSTGTGLIAHTRLQQGAEPATLAETTRLLIAAWLGAGRADAPSPVSLPPGVLAFAAVAAHASGDEVEEARHTQALLDLARASDDDDAPQQVAGDVLFYTHPLEAAEMLRRYLLDHPVSRALFTLFAQPIVRAELTEAGVTGLDEFDSIDGLGDPEDPGFVKRVSDRVSELVLQGWKPDLHVQAWHQSRAGIAIEFWRRQGMPAEIARLRRKGVNAGRIL